MSKATKLSPIIKLSPRQFAVLRHVWTLSKEEKEWLDSYFILRTNAINVVVHCKRVDDSGKDILVHRGIHYQLEYLDCSREFLKRVAPATQVLLSLRHRKSDSFAVALVMLPNGKISQEATNKFSEF